MPDQFKNSLSRIQRLTRQSSQRIQQRGQQALQNSERLRPEIQALLNEGITQDVAGHTQEMQRISQNYAHRSARIQRDTQSVNRGINSFLSGLRKFLSR